MELAVHGKQMDVGDSLRQHVEEKMAEISGKYFNHTTYATVTFSRVGHGHPQTRVNVLFKLGRNILVTSEAVDGLPKAAFDIAAEKAAKQLRRYKRRLRDHHERIEKAPAHEFLTAREHVLAATPDQDNGHEESESGGDPLVIAEMATSIQTMTVSEAVMRLDLSGEPALLFRNASHGGINMVHRRDDGNVGWVDPEQRAAVPAASKATKKA